MKKFVILCLIIGLFTGCGKNEPILPQSYENISFTDLIKTLNLKKSYSDSNSIIYKSEILDSAEYRRNNFYDYNEPALDYCKSKSGKFIELYDFSTETFKQYIEYEKKSTYYCKKDNDILFVTYKNSYHQPWQKYPRYIYYFVESNVLANEIKNFVDKKEKNEFMKTQNEEYILKKDENKIKKQNSNSFTRGIDSNATNKEVSKLISQVAPKTDNFIWTCETVDEYKLPHTNEEGKNIVKKCTVDTDINLTFKATCTYTILPASDGYTACKLGW